MIKAEEARQMLAEKQAQDNSIKNMVLYSFKKLIDSNIGLAVKQGRNTLNLHIHLDEVKYLGDMLKILKDAGYKINETIDVDDFDPDFPPGSKIIFMEF